MSVKIEIRDVLPDGASAVRLCDLLGLLEPRANDLKWAILELHATGDSQRIGIPIPELEQQITAAARGLVLSYPALKGLARALDEILDIVIVAATDIDRIPRVGPGCDLEQSSQFVLESIDGSVWSIFLRDDSLLDDFMRTFREVAVIRT